jgi:2-dehydro-3-deoxygluconokinase
MKSTFTVTFGEIMLRLKSPERERLFQSPILEATFGGGEANVAVSLAMFGAPARFVTALPKGLIGDAAMIPLRAHGVDVSAIRRSGSRVGIYYLETGADMRPSLVVYDRTSSSASEMKPGDFDWDSIFSDAQWFHVTGITPALSQSAADTVMQAVQKAGDAGVRVSIDLNYRKKLWNYGVPAPNIMKPIVSNAHVLIANEEDIQLGLGIALESENLKTENIDLDAYRCLTDKVKQEFPHLSHVAVTLRESYSADRNGWSAILNGPDEFNVSRRYMLNEIVDRVGGGDSFAAGLIYGLQEYREDKKALEFAVAASALKHTIPGDMNLVSKEEVERLLDGEASGRVSR